MTKINVIEKLANNTDVIMMESDDLKVKVSNLGCTLLEIHTKDKNGEFDDIILGPEDFTHPESDSAYFGRVVGRFANRIGGAEFELNGVKYTLAKNNGVNHLHGGLVGFDQKVFDYEIREDRIDFKTFSPDMEEGYPGNMNFYVSYILKGNSFEIQYGADTDRDTICNFTNHVYFNLSGKALDSIKNHYLELKADKYMPGDEGCLVTGERAPVEGTVFDFRKAKTIGEDMDFNVDQIRMANGYDHAFIFNADKDQVVLSYPETGRKVTMTTDLPMIHIYTGNFIQNGTVGKHGRKYESYQGIAMETENAPDSIHNEENPTCILRAGEKFSSFTKYVFEVEA